MSFEEERLIDKLVDRLDAEGLAWGGRPAVYDRGELVFTHKELLAEASRLATELVAAGVEPGQLVALEMEKSPAYLVGLLGVWCAGAAFLPLRPSLPEGRRRWMREDAAPRAILRSQPRAKGVGLDVEVTAGASRRREGLAYVIYTSGSSGRPRGVAVGHGGVSAFVEAQVRAFRLKPESRALWYLSPDFDASLSDILTALYAGASIFVERDEELKSPRALMGRLRGRGITHVDLPPSLLAALDPESVGPSLQTLIIGGEVCPPSQVRRWSRRVRVVNCYGPTETTVCASMAVCGPDWERPLIGEPIEGVRFEVRGGDGGVASAGEVGELWISGPCVALGYLNCPELTQAQFCEHDGRRTFRTGDLVRVCEGGGLAFLGRADRRVKLGGKWVNLEALEVSLGAAPGIARAAVVPREIHGAKALVAFYMATGEALCWPEGLPSMKRQEVEALPLTASGKVDLPALEAWPLVRRASSGRDRESTRFATPMEAAIASLYGAVLDRETPGRGEDFFCLGGDSLRALYLVALAARRGITVTLEMLADDGRVWAVAKKVAEGAETVDEPRQASDLAKEAEELVGELPSLAQERGQARRPWRRLFLTGATGSLGRLVLRELLDQTAAEVYCLVRGSSEDAARARLGLYSERVHVVLGDLTLPRMGLSKERWEALAAVDAIFHLAAKVNLAASFDELKAANLRGTLEVMRLQRGGRFKELHYVSSLSVAVGTDRPAGAVPAEPLVPDVRVWGGYAQSKWAAEWLVRGAARGARIYRPGLLVGGEGAGAAAEMLDYFWRGTVRLGCAPREYLDRLELDITPVGWAARTLVERSLTAAPGAITHIASPRPLTMRFLVDCLRVAGEEVEVVATQEWCRRLYRHLDLELSGYMLAMCRCLGDQAWAQWRPFDLFQATGYVLAPS